MSNRVQYTPGNKNLLRIPLTELETNRLIGVFSQERVDEKDAHGVSLGSVDAILAKLRTSTITDELGCLEFLGVQCAIFYKTRRFLEQHVDAGTVQQFDRWTYTVLDGGMTLTEMIPYWKESVAKYIVGSTDALEKAIGTITVQDVVAGMALYGTADDKREFSLSGSVRDAATNMHVDSAGKLFVASHESTLEKKQDGIIHHLQTMMHGPSFARLLAAYPADDETLLAYKPMFAQILKNKKLTDSEVAEQRDAVWLQMLADSRHGDDPALAGALQALRTHGFDGAKCTPPQQDVLFGAMATERRASPEARELRDMLAGSSDKMVNIQQWDALESWAMTPGYTDVTLPLATGESLILRGMKTPVIQRNCQSVKDYGRDGIPLRADIEVVLLDANGGERVVEVSTYDFSQKGAFAEYLEACMIMVHAREHEQDADVQNMSFAQGQQIPHSFMDVSKGSKTQTSSHEQNIDRALRGTIFPRLSQPLSYAEKIANTRLDDAARVEKAWETITANVPAEHDFWTALTEQKKQHISDAIVRAHYSTVENHELGTDGGPACAFYYTDDQIKEKFAIIMASGLHGDLVRILMDDAIAGIAPEGIRLEMAELRNTIQDLNEELAKVRNEIAETTQRGFPDIHPDNERVLGIKKRNLTNDIADARDMLREIAKKERADVTAWNAKTPQERAAVEAEEARLRRIQEDADAGIQEIDDTLQRIAVAKEPLREAERDVHARLNEAQNTLRTKERSAQRFEQAPDVQPIPKEEREAYRIDAKARSDARIAAADKRIKEANTQLDAMLPPEKPEDMPAYLNAKKAREEERTSAQAEREAAEVEYKLVASRLKEKDLQEDKEAILAKEKTPEGKLIKVRSDLKGYNFVSEDDAGLRKGNQLFLSYGDSGDSQIGPLGSQWLKLVITQVDAATGAIEFSMHGVRGPLETTSGQTLEGKKLSFSDPDEFKSYVTGEWGEVFKMPDPSNRTMESWGVALKQDVAKYNFGDKKTWVDNLLATIDFGSMQKQGPERKGEKIAYMGKPINGSSGQLEWNQERYKVEYVAGGIKLTTPSYKPAYDIPVMDYTSFLIFCADKGLQGMSQEEVDMINAKKGLSAGESYIGETQLKGIHDDDVFNKNDTRGLFGWKWLSINGILNAKKKFTGLIEDKIKSMNKKNDEDAEAALWDSGWVKRLSKAGIPIISKALDDKIIGRLNDADKEKLKKIDEFKGEPDKFKDTTPGGGHDIVKLTLFDVSQEKATEKLLKVAGYFQWAIEKGGLYDRSLAAWSDNGRGGKWIELLMGPQWKEKYHAWYDEKKIAYGLDPQNEELKNMVTYGEPYFLSKVVNEKLPPASKEVQEAMGEKYSKAWLGGLLDKAVESGIASREKLSSKKNELDKKEHMNFASLYKDQEFFGAIQSKGVITGLSYLEPMAKRVKGSSENLKKRSMCMLYPMLSGQLVYGANEAAIKKEYMSLSRQYGFSLGLYARGQPNSRDELIKLLQIFESETPSYKGKSIADITKDTSDLKGFTNALKLWRGDPDAKSGMGNAVMSYMQSPGALFDLEDTLKTKANNNPDDQDAINRANVVSRYIDTKVNDKDAADISGDIKTDSIALKKNIRSLSPGFARSWLWKTKNNHATFAPDAIENIPGVWAELKNKLTAFANKKTLTERDVEFLFNKFFVFNDAVARDIKPLLASLLHPHIALKDKQGNEVMRARDVDMIKKHVTGIYDQKAPLSGDNLDPVIREGLEAWENVLRHKDIQVHLGNVIARVDALKPYARTRKTYESNPEVARQDLLKKYSGQQAAQINRMFAGGSAFIDDDEDDGYGYGYGGYGMTG